MQGNVAACVLDEPPSNEFVESLAAWVRQLGFVTQLVILPALSARNLPTSARLPAEILEPPHTPDRIGRALLVAAEAHARARGFAKLTLEVREDNVRARGLYQERGFRDFELAGRAFQTLFLAKSLTAAPP